MSEFGKLNWKDLGKGLVVAVGTTVITSLIPILQNGAIPDWATLKVILIAGASAGLAYILKNLFTNSNNELAKKEPPK